MRRARPCGSIPHVDKDSITRGPGAARLEHHNDLCAAKLTPDKIVRFDWSLSLVQVLLSMDARCCVPTTELRIHLPNVSTLERARRTRHRAGRNPPDSHRGVTA